MGFLPRTYKKVEFGRLRRLRYGCVPILSQQAPQSGRSFYSCAEPLLSAEDTVEAGDTLATAAGAAASLADLAPTNPYLQGQGT